MVQDECRVQLEVFEGPLDLLLYLIRKEEVDIYDIPIERITTQYMEYLGLMRMLDLNIAGEFIVMAATLMMIKSRMLLPEEDRPALEPEEEDPRWDLVRRLVEYKKFKEAAEHLLQREILQENVFPHGGEPTAPSVEPDPSLALENISLFDLLAAFNQALKRIQTEDLTEIFAEQFTVADKIEEILLRARGGRPLAFSSLFREAATRHEIVCTFLALLELVRLRQVTVRQEADFGDITIWSAERAPV